MSSLSTPSSWIKPFVLGLVFVGIAFLMPVLFSFIHHFQGPSEAVMPSKGQLSIAYDQPLMTYEPTISDTITRSYMVNAYEGLVRFDRNFNIEPALALSWGMFDDLTWQFKLRPAVSFHDGSSFGVDDVLASIDRARNHPNSQVQDLVSSIDHLEIVDDFTVKIMTSSPDPTLLNKLTALFIVPSESSEVISIPVGTGPYRFLYAIDQKEWRFEAYEAYWGEIPLYSELRLVAIPDKFQRYEAFVAKDIDVLAQVPPVFVNALLDSGYKIASQPSLEVNFLMFDSTSLDSSFRELALRQALTYAFDSNSFDRFTSGFAHPINQFVSRGVFGYNPDIQDRVYDLDRSKALIVTLSAPPQVVLDLPEGLEAFGVYIQEQLESIGLFVELKIWSYRDYINHVSSGRSDFFFLGWRSELGDAAEFFANVVHSKTTDGYYGTSNNQVYLNPEVNALIKQVEHNLLESDRLEQLQTLMRIVVQEDIIGLPLFETDILTAIQPELNWEPRLDNLILARDFS